MSNVCEHGSLKRKCQTCELLECILEIERLEAGYKARGKTIEAYEETIIKQAEALGDITEECHMVLGHQMGGDDAKVLASFVLKRIDEVTQM